MTQHTTPLTRFWPLLALVAIALFPFGWLAELWPLADRIGTFLFATEAAHAVGHATIFGAIGLSLLAVFPALRQRPLVYLGIILLLGIGQEGFQLIYKGRGLAINDFTDLGTDLVGAGLVFALTRLGQAYRKDARGDTSSSAAAD